MIWTSPGVSSVRERRICSRSVETPYETLGEIFVCPGEVETYRTCGRWCVDRGRPFSKRHVASSAQEVSFSGGAVRAPLPFRTTWATFRTSSTLKQSSVHTEACTGMRMQKRAAIGHEEGPLRTNLCFRQVPTHEIAPNVANVICPEGAGNRCAGAPCCIGVRRRVLVAPRSGIRARARSVCTGMRCKGPPLTKPSA